MKLKETVHVTMEALGYKLLGKKRPLYSSVQNILKTRLRSSMRTMSFNSLAAPIGESPRDAVRTYMTSGIDTLYIEDYKVIK